LTLHQHNVPLYGKGEAGGSKLQSHTRRALTLAMTGSLSPTMSLTVTLLGIVAMASVIAWAFIAFFRNSDRKHHWVPTFISGLSVFLLLVGILVVPVDIFSISTTPTAFHWDHRLEVVKNIYDIDFAAMLIICLLLVPFAFFYYEEGGGSIIETTRPEDSSRGCVALKYTLCFALAIVVLLGFGTAIVTVASHHKDISDVNSQQWINELLSDENRPTLFTAVRFTIGCFSALGMLGWVSYTALGLVAIPVEICMAGTRSSAVQLTHSINSSVHAVEGELQAIRKQRASILSKRTITGNTLQRRERDALRSLETRFKLLSHRKKRMARLALSSQSSCCASLAQRCQLLRLLCGAFLFVLSASIAAAAALTTTDKGFRSSFHDGFELSGGPHAWNPLDKLFVVMSRAFPLDYIALSLLVVYLLCATLKGIMIIGVRCCCCQLFVLRPQRSSPQAILVVSAILVTVTLAAMISLDWLVPQYAAFGSQQYRLNAIYPQLRTGDHSGINAETGQADIHAGEYSPCTLSDVTSEQAIQTGCRMSQLAAFFKSLTTSMPFFGLLYVVSNAVFAAAWLLWALLASCCRRPWDAMCCAGKNSLHSDWDDEDYDDGVDEEGEMLRLLRA